MADDMERLRESARRQTAERDRQRNESSARALVEIKHVAQRDLPAWKKAIQHQIKNNWLSLLTLDNDHREVRYTSFLVDRVVPVGRWPNGACILGDDAEVLHLYAAELGRLLGEPFSVTAYPRQRERVITTDLPYPHTDYTDPYIAISW